MDGCQQNVRNPFKTQAAYCQATRVAIELMRRCSSVEARKNLCFLLSSYRRRKEVVLACTLLQRSHNISRRNFALRKNNDMNPMHSSNAGKTILQ